MPASIERTLAYALLTVQEQFALRDALFDVAETSVFTLRAYRLGLLDAKGAPTKAGRTIVDPAEMARRLVEPDQGPTAAYPTVGELTKQDVPTARALGLPRSPRALFDQLAAEPSGDWPMLLKQCRAHAQAFVDAFANNEFLPMEEAQQLAEGLAKLHARIETHATPALADRLAWIAARYFVIRSDGSDDFEGGGLDDDVAVFNAVCDRLGYADLKIAAA